MSLLVRHNVNPIKLRVNKRGTLGLVELSLFVNVNLWAAAVVIWSVAPEILSESLLFDLVLYGLTGLVNGARQLPKITLV